MPNGSPKSQRIAWFRDGLKIESNSKYAVNRTELTIRQLKSGDAGPYLCKVSNSYTNVTAEANVKIIGKIFIFFSRYRIHCLFFF